LNSIDKNSTIRTECVVVIAMRARDMPLLRAEIINGAIELKALRNLVAAANSCYKVGAISNSGALPAFFTMGSSLGETANCISRMDMLRSPFG